ncbi:MAG: hypothetical protein NVS2B7_13920 [Herpetosiphon sp.]
MHRSLFAVVGVLALLVALSPRSVGAEDANCFHETGECLSGRFESYWHQTGGLPVFGFPVTPPQPIRSAEGGVFYSQSFERNRFELHPENAAPYDVLLGRLGDERLRQNGIAWEALPRAGGPSDGCLWFAETRHNVCDQQAGLGFKSYWLSHGVNDQRLPGYGRSLMLWGLPLTEPRMEVNPSGDRVLTQWFERARFEWHPELPAAYVVSLGLLGNEISGGRRAAQPARLVIPALGIDTPVVAAGLDTERVPIVPRHDVGWYAGSARPGQGSNVVMWGHVLRFRDSPEIPAPFADLQNLQLGATIKVISAGGQVHRYRLEQQVRERPDQLDLLQPTRTERLTLISCIGANIISNGQLTKEFRLLSIAVPVD